MAAPVGDVASPLWAGGTQWGGVGSSFPWGKRVLLVFAHPGPMVGRSSSPKGRLGDESLVKIWSDQFHLTVGANSSFIYF